MKYYKNLARAPLAVADSFEISLPPCFQRQIVDQNVVGGKVQRFKEKQIVNANR